MGFLALLCGNFKTEIMELELKHIAPYLPYGLKWKLQRLSKFVMSGITRETLFAEDGAVLTWPKHPDLPRALFPLLRPLSSLAEVIEVDGRSFIPIIELVRLENGGGIFEYQIEKLFIQEFGAYIGLYYTSSVGLVEFSYNPGLMTFTMMRIHKDESYKCDLTVNHQLEMFQKLFEWHFDVYGLINKKLAVAIEY